MLRVEPPSISTPPSTNPDEMATMWRGLWCPVPSAGMSSSVKDITLLSKMWPIRWPNFSASTVLGRWASSKTLIRTYQWSSDSKTRSKMDIWVGASSSFFTISTSLWPIFLRNLIVFSFDTFSVGLFTGLITRSGKHKGLFFGRTTVQSVVSFDASP